MSSQPSVNCRQLRPIVQITRAHSVDMVETIDCRLIDARAVLVRPEGPPAVESENMARFLMSDYAYTQHETLTLKNLFHFFAEGNYSRESEATKGNERLKRFCRISLRTDASKNRVIYFH